MTSVLWEVRSLAKSYFQSALAIPALALLSPLRTTTRRCWIDATVQANTANPTDSQPYICKVELSGPKGQILFLAALQASPRRRWSSVKSRELVSTARLPIGRFCSKIFCGSCSEPIPGLLASRRNTTGRWRWATGYAPVPIVIRPPAIRVGSFTLAPPPRPSLAARHSPGTDGLTSSPFNRLVVFIG
jgi:hypothetical protein